MVGDCPARGRGRRRHLDAAHCSSQQGFMLMALLLLDSRLYAEEETSKRPGETSGLSVVPPKGSDLLSSQKGPPNVSNRHS